MMAPTERQLAAIAIIEKKLPFVKFVGTTKKEAFDFIAEHMEASQKVQMPRRSRPSYSSRHQDIAPESSAMSDRERYENYIEEISWNYVEAAGDDGWGGFASRDMARRLHSFEDWKRNYG